MPRESIFSNGEGGGGLQRKSRHRTMSLSMTNAMDSAHSNRRAVIFRLLLYYWLFYYSSICLMSRQCFDSSISCRFSLLSFYVLLLTGLISPFFQLLFQDWCPLPGFNVKFLRPFKWHMPKILLIL